jgi:hypothetical protein
MLPAAMPQHRTGSVAGEVADLFDLDGEQFMTLVCLCLSALIPIGNHAVSVINGPTGSGKTTLAGFIRSLVDPHKAGLEALPLAERDLAVQADSCRLLAYDNLSALSPQQQDWLCRLTTGFVFRPRRLYADRELMAFTWCGPVLLNGIPDVVGRSDLASRLLAIRLAQPIDGCLPAEAMHQRLDRLRPRFLGYLFDGMVTALARAGKVELNLPRLSSPAYWCAAAAPAYSWTADDVLALFRQQAKDALQRVAVNDPVASSVYGMMTTQNLWRWPQSDTTVAERLGSLTELHNDLTSRAALYAKDWPKLPSEFAAALRCAELALAACGIEIEWHATGLQLALTRRLTA